MQTKPRSVLILEKVNRILRRNKAVNEASLSRTRQHAVNPDQAFSIITADKSAGFFYDIDDITKLPEKQQRKIAQDTAHKNNMRRKELMAALKDNGYGYFPVNGYYVETQEDQAGARPEKSFVVYDLKNDPDSFLKTMMRLGKEFDQECIVYRDVQDDEFIWVDTINYTDWNGQEHKIGDVHPLGNKFITNINRNIHMEKTPSGNEKEVGRTKAYSSVKGRQFRVGDYEKE